MCEELYVRLLRLFPSKFRKEYEAEALQLIRDRLRDERGLFKRARLFWDLLADIAVGIPLAYRNSYALTESASLSPISAEVPSFRLLDSAPLRPGSILVGCLLSLFALVAFGFVMNHSEVYRPSPSRSTSPIESVLERLNRPVSQETSGKTYQEPLSANSSVSAPSHPELPSEPTAAQPTLRANSKSDARNEVPVKFPLTRNSNGPSGARQSTGRQTTLPISQLHSRSLRQPTNIAAATVAPNRLAVFEAADRGMSVKQAPTTDNFRVDAAYRQRLVEAIDANLKEHYFDRAVAKQTADALLAHEEDGSDNTAKDGAGLAALLTKQMRDASHDMHLVVEYSPDTLPAGPPTQTVGARERYRGFLKQNNCFFNKAQILSHNIGYLKIDSFPDPSICRQTAVANMTSLNKADAIIFDLRDNAGGFEGMVSLIASYLFDHSQYMYSPRGAPTDVSWTKSPVAGNRLADKPVYILTSASTWSAAEQFSYDLKMLKRATLVGETTRGGAHAGVFHRVDDHFGVGIPEQKVVNPFGNADWEGIGVEPDVHVNASDALATAVKLASATLQKK